MNLGKIKRIKVRDVWPDEARDFTPWLRDNLSELGEKLQLDLETVRSEAAVGDFCCDLLARDLGRDRMVVIENQFGSTDHDHLGKMLTYAAGLEASSVVWVAEKIREEHRETLEWLNRHTDKQLEFFAVTIEVIQIDSSVPAPQMNVIVFPNEWQRGTRNVAQENSPLAEAYKNWFQILIDELREKYKFTNARAAQFQNWYSFRLGISGIDLNTHFAQSGHLQAEVYIDWGSAEQNKAIFDALYSQRSEIEKEFGQPLHWSRLDDKRASRVGVAQTGTIESNEAELIELRVWVIQQLVKLKTVFYPRVRQITSTMS